jgi:uncharacterized repeat protein (TIGR03843 family)
MTTAAPALDLLARGAMAVKGRMPWSSNATFLVELALDGSTGLGVYKPLRGERPLWDFPRGIFKREIAAYHLSEALGWALVPPTVWRGEGPLGEGSLQAFVAADFEQHYFTLLESLARHEELRRICAFDLIANNADRKSGHCLLGRDGRVHAIDNGLCFHVEDKLRTVIWAFAGEPIPQPIASDIRRLLRAGLPAALRELLDPEELEALALRAETLLERRRFPEDRGGSDYPWPLV